MYSYAITCIVVLMLLDESDCRLHRRNHPIRRQNAQMSQTSSQTIQTFYPTKPISPQLPPVYKYPVYPTAPPEFSSLPYSAIPPAFPNYQPGSVAFSGNDSSPVVYEPPVLSSTLIIFVPSPQYRNSNFYPRSINTKRRRKNVSENKNDVEKLLEQGKKMLEKPSMGNILGEKNYLKSLTDSLDDDEINGNVTFIPIPKGIQLKTVSKDDKKNVEKVVNITSSTQKTVSFGNSTEIENVVEMQMEKKIEDDKGDNKGSEEVRIIETELVKPVVKKNWKSLTHKNRKRRLFHNRRFAMHRRSKRSETGSGLLRPRPIYNKMARRFLSDLKRKERMVERNGFLNRQETLNSRQPEFEGITSNVKEETGKLIRDESVYNSDEMGDFLKHFLDQLKKLKNTRESNKSNAKHKKFSNTSEKWYSLKQTKRKKKNRQHEYPDHMKMVMNLNMTWDAKMREHSARSPNISGKLNYAVDLLTKAVRVESATQQMALKVLFVDERKETDPKLLTVMLLLSVVMFLLPILGWTLPKLYRTARLTHTNSAVKTYRFCHEHPHNEEKALLGHFWRENICAEDYPQLEWQCENGDWLSEKEMDFK